MAPVLNNFKTNNFRPRRKVLNFINNKTKQIPVKRLEPVFYEPNNTKVMEPNFQPVVEPVVEQVVEPRRSTRIKRKK